MEKSRMTWWHEGEELTKKVLDTIDFVQFIKDKQISSLEDLVDELEHVYEKTDVVDNEYMEGSLFNCFDYSDVEDYLQKRYGKDGPIRMYEESKVRIELAQ